MLQTAPQNRKKISKAINLLEEATQNEATRIQDTVYDGLTTMKEKASAAATEMGENISAEAQRQVARVDRHVKSDPWKFMGITALIGLIAGFFIGKKR